MNTVRDFKQTSSIVRRLQLIILLMAVLLLVASLATWLSSRRYVEELQHLNHLNRLMSLATRSVQNLVSGRESLEKVISDGPERGKQHVPAFEASRDQAELAIMAALELTVDLPQLRPYFLDARASLDQIEQIAQRVFSILEKQAPGSVQELGKEVLIIRQFELDAIDSMRKARLEMTSMSDVLLEEVYRHRYMPFLLSFVVSLLFFCAALTLGMSVTKRLKSSIQGLLAATDRVAGGNLSVTIPIQAHDEIGRLTYAFDRMLGRLRESMERTTHLQKITAEFSRALAPQEVADAVVAEGIAILGASGGGVLTLSENGERFELLRATGIPEETLEAWHQYTLGQEVPVSLALRDFKPYFAETREELFRNLPSDVNPEDYDFGSSMVIPLGEEGALIGILTFRFEKERAFSEYERNFALALGALASQAYKRASLYEDAKRAIEIRDSFLSIAAHELKTPLTSLKLQLQLGEMQVDKSKDAPLSPEKIKRIFLVCHSQADRLNSLVDDLLDVGRIERGTIVYTFEAVNLRQMAEGVLDRFGEALRLKDCAVEAVSEEPILARADPFRIEQVLINLLSNSAKYGQGKPVKVKVGRKGERVFFSVVDQGMGIAPEKQELIFDRFERAISARNISGLGLGLFISRRIVDAHRGRIRVESSLGEGATFTVELPVAEAQAAPNLEEWKVPKGVTPPGEARAG
jgi:signal transduction histidine kinase/HAMP domain-containing protein